MSDARQSDIFQPGDLLNNTYRIEAVLGRGGTSEVYRARSEISGRVVALKVLKSEFAKNEDYLVLMTREEEMRDIRHDAVVRYSENHRTQDGHVYLVMDYVDGPGLDRKLREGGMSADDLMVVGARVAEGLQAAHSRNIVHRDLSPDNIILRGGDPAEAVIIDFGIAKDANPGAATIVGNEFAGKYAYAAPEQLSGRTDARSDIYSLGALLLSTYRGKAPEIGNNPMEVLRRKAEPLDTEGVPEPLKSLIDRMTAPNPDARLQSAAEVLDAIDPAFQKTVIPTRPSTVPPPKPARAAEATSADGVPRRGHSLLWAVLVVVVLAAAVAGAWFGGLIPAGLPTADPYTLIAQQGQDGPPSLKGHAPSDGIRQQLAGTITAAGGTADLTLAKGDIAPDWGASVAQVLKDLTALDEWKMTVEGNNVTVTGLTADRDLRQATLALLDGPKAPGGLVGSADITLGPRVLTADMLAPVMQSNADCGPLRLVDPPQGGYPMGATVVIQGQLAETASRIKLYDAASAIAGDRKVTIDAEVLNPSLCQIESHLPQAPPGGVKIDFSFGKTGETNPSGRYFVNENPVIDIVLPDDVKTGYLYVSIVDVTGNVYHLLPNRNRPENAVMALRNGQNGDLPVRVSYSVAEAQNTSKLAFTVDNSTLGKSKVIVIHSSDPLFNELRPTTESAAGYAEALKRQAADTGNVIYSLDSRLLVTAEP
ncbi:MAG: protein kinase [Paracoccaceae bacterium]